MFSFCIITHEFGHVFTALYFKWNIKKIIILPFGGLTIFDELLNRPIKEEFFIAIMGPLFQCVIYFIFILFKINSIDYTIINKVILFINLLPIIPLDGAKIIRLICDYLFSLNISLNINLIISFLFLFLLLIYNYNNFYVILMCIFLFKENIKQYINRKMYFNKFLIERALYNFNFKKIRYIYNIKKIKRDYYHMIYDGKKYIKESNFLLKKFDL